MPRRYRYFYIVVTFLSILIASFQLVKIVYFQPKFNLNYSDVSKIQISSLAKDSNQNVINKTILIENQDMIKIFCNDLKYSSNRKLFMHENARKSYRVSIFLGNKVLKFELINSISGYFYILVVGDFEDTGVARRFSNTKIRHFLNSYIEHRI